MDQDTIAAIATPAGIGGIGIIRLSGPEAITIARGLFTKRKKTASTAHQNNLTDTCPKTMQYGLVVDKQNNTVLDEVFMCLMPGPNSYTREDVAELHCHGGITVLQTVLNLIVRQGARLANPGEFTQRAFLNGRIDLTQAEAVADLINAKTETAAKIAARQINGAFYTIINESLSIIMEGLTQLQARIEFPDDIEAPYNLKHLAEQIKTRICSPFKQILEAYDFGKIHREGMLINIVGAPNVGKSSLLNRIIQKDKAIVSDIPGTTRDIVEETILLKGLPITLRDTAGIHETRCPVEKLGIKKTEQSLKDADLVILVIDGKKGVSEHDRAIYKKIKQKNILVVINKIDLKPEARPNTFFSQKGEPLRISARTGEGMETLLTTIKETCETISGSGEGIGIVPNLRQKKLLDEFMEIIDGCVLNLDSGHGDELITEDLSAAMRVLQRLNGEALEVDTMQDIFNRFCIGK